MTTKTEDVLRLVHMADAIQEVFGYIGNSDYAQFAHNDDIRVNVAVMLNQIGGAAAELSDEFKEEHGDTVDWDVLKGLQYSGYNEQLERDTHGMWYLIHDDLPVINEQIQDLLVDVQDDEALDQVALNEEDKKDIMDRYREKVARSHRAAAKRDVSTEDETPEPREEGIDDPEQNFIETEEQIRKGPFNP